MKISEYPQEIKAFAEFGCMVCIAERRKGNPKYNGCSCRPHDTYCPWMEEVIYTAMNAQENENKDIFTNWANIPIVQETFKQKAESVPKEKNIYTNIRGIK